MEEMINEEVSKSLKFSHVGILMIDSLEAFTTQDMMILDNIISEGRGVVIVANKWDLVTDRYKTKAVRWMTKQLEKGFGDAKGIPLAFISAKTG